MTMMTMPATIESSADQARINPPIREALAPSATNTVEKPSTNITADIITARLEDGFRLFVFEVLDGRAGEVNQIGRHQRQHARRQKADQAGNQRRGDRDIVDHAVTAIVANLRLGALVRPDIGGTPGRSGLM